jgi:hypothetical protein
VIALDRREPGQHSQDTHDRDYVLVDKRVQDKAVEVIATGAEDAVGRARTAVLVAELRDAPTSGDLELPLRTVATTTTALTHLRTADAARRS